MKKLLALLLLVTMIVLCLVACGGKTENNTTEDSNQNGVDNTDDETTNKPTDSSKPEDSTVTDSNTEENDKPSLTVPAKVDAYMKKQTKLEYTVTGDLTPTFTSQNPEVFTVSEDGTITGIKAGKAALLVTAGKFSKTCLVNVSTYEPAAPGKTEEELGVLPVGSYTITVANDAKTPVTYGVDPSTIKEASAADTISLSTNGSFNEFTIVYQTIGNDAYYIVWMKDQNLYNLCPPSNYRISTGNEILMYYKKTVSSNLSYYNDMADGFKWHIDKNADGTYSFISHIDTSYCLSYKDGKFVAEKLKDATGVTSFNLDLKERGTKVFKEYISSKGNITLRLPIDIERRSGLTDERAQKWANDLNIAFDKFVELTSYPVYDNIVVKAYENCGHIGYVYTNCKYNVISIQKNFAYRDLEKMVIRDKEAAGDWNFCAMHEMGHIFDSQTGWYFETEMMTDLKLAYCIEQGGGTVAPSEFAAETYFSFDNIMDCYAELGGNMNESKTYGAYQAAYVMLRVQKTIGWEPFKQTYKWFIENNVNPSGNYNKFIQFIDKLTEYSGKDVKKLFTTNEWNTFCEKYGYTGA